MRVLPTSARPHVLVLLALVACKHDDAPAVHDPVIDEFRLGERDLLVAYNDLLHEQKANHIDERGLAAGIEAKVLVPWRALRAKLDAATVPAGEQDVYVLLRRYLAERQTSWEAYVAGLTSDNDEQAKPHYATYHAQNDAAQADAQQIGAEFRRLGLGPLQNK